MGDYPDIQDEKRRSVLPKRLQRQLADFAKKGLFRSRRINSWRARSIVRELLSLPPAVIPGASREIRLRARLWFRDEGDVVLLRSFPDLAWVFVFHGDGYIREAALKAINGPAPSAFMLCAVAYQLNHWVPEVRQAAAKTFTGLAATTRPGLLSEAACFLLAAKRDWQRGAVELCLIDDLLSRQDVRSHLVQRLRRLDVAAPHRILLAIAHDERMDPYLTVLMGNAGDPALWALVARTLLRGEFRWPAGFEEQWVDKSMGKKRRVTIFAVRKLTLGPYDGDLVAELAYDTQVQVRKVAMQAIIDAPDMWTKREHLIQRLSGDSSSVIRAGMDFIRRQQAKETLDPQAS